MIKNKKARVIAFYLPQYHPIPENDAWWGKGFTEWTNVGKAKQLFKGHYQPRVPADLGYYDLRMTEIREAQAEMAREAGVEGFMYWHYWFGNGKRLLERPFNDVLESGKPDFPFCLGWANHSWYAKNWNAKDSKKDKLLIEQLYPGVKDNEMHFYSLLNAFRDNRYLTIEGKPIFLIFAPHLVPKLNEFISQWNKLAIQNGLNGIYFIGQAGKNIDCKEILHNGFNGVCRSGIQDVHNKIRGRFTNSILWHLRKYIGSSLTPLNKYDYLDIVNNLSDFKLDSVENIYPSILPNFDHSPRSGRDGLIYTNSTPELFRKMIVTALNSVNKKDYEHRILFLRSWNEWAEGNYMEPDLKFGKKYIDVLMDEIMEK